MNEIFLRYFLEFSLIIPAVFFALLPVIEYMKIKSRIAVMISIFLMMILIFISAYFSARYGLRIRVIFSPLIVVSFFVYIFAVDLSLSKKLFCFFNSIMLCAICNIYTITLMPRYEIKNLMWHSARLFSLSSAYVCLGISILEGFIFYRTLKIKIPMLLNEEYLGTSWNFLFLIPSVMAILIYWMSPISPLVVMTGRVQPVFLVLITFVLFIAFMFYDIFYKITFRLTESAKLQQENNLLQMEGKRYNELKNYMNETRTLRHDFRQHIAVLSEFARAGNLNGILEYTDQLNENARAKYILYCANSAVDAAASHYDRIAKENNIKIEWRLELPSVLNIKESDYCAMLGNLIENSLNAVKNLKDDKKNIKVISSMLSEVMLGISIDNPFEGDLIFKNGLPVSKREGHGLGLISISNIVNRYNGSLRIKTENKIFSVDILLYCLA